MNTHKKRLVIISQTIRRDLQAPLRLFKHIDIVHLYENASYGDMKKEDFNVPRTLQFQGVRDLYNNLVTLKPTIVQVPEPWANKTAFTSAVVVLWYARHFHPRIIMPVFENRPLNDKLPKYKRVLVALLMSKLNNYVDTYIVLNIGARKLLENLTIPQPKIKKLLWGSWGINVNEFTKINHTPVTNYQSPVTPHTIIFLGRVSKAKGIPMLVDAFTEIRATFPDVTLTIAGPAGDAIDDIKHTGITSIGPLKNTDVPEYLRSGTVLVMPSQTTKEWEEQVGMVGLQSLACGTPVITTNSGAIPEYFKNGKGAVVIDEKDTDGLVTALKRFLNDMRYRDEQSRKGRDYIEKNFDVRKHIKQIETFLIELGE
ncbi:hypothetical protein COS66_00710 [Candidatus Berkelbacteria bacterium CG06_land_8_20_14_3_00_43_10]|uniref:Glycosyl transferase family 1 domain-containing protein n=1 Tax=Candidatus Berkelbacteria bacterium CG10_big_fil_rev_8_21_14_0_10_43_14 TaxID=1974515 RepID=A0A2M6R813_9BACT|nr:MAG: hypothetical protein AUK41_00920 [Candidatus Berkelbacteria bacterium CG2_30_43_20]PIS06675.1 MAG: hypothetical protein COT79_03365 [Candidatus Berkelbacteria bacterium CG10_big_fil_rev_8_21_14_0_10_43_14]PIU87472.1 MAG: hypothetical protein COS66_00710 [Candidatus Berkelbacteria bacterium CG06_land_8_20_14_3_00_43_10]